MASPLTEYAVVPGLGRVRWSLYDDMTKRVYSELRQRGEIQRLRQVDQLGSISGAMDCAHHKRWEYVALTLYLLGLIGASGGRGDMSTKISFSNGVTVGKAEVACLWMLIMQTGHLRDTFAAERYLCFSAIRNPLVKQALLEDVPTPLAKYCERQVVGGKWQRMYEVLAMARLHTMFPAGEIRDFAIECCALYCEPTNEKSRHAKDILSVIRTLAFMYLDSQFTDSSIYIDPVALTLGMHEDASLVARILDPREPLGVLLGGVSTYLEMEVYRSSASQPYVYAVLEQLSGDYGRRLKSTDQGVVNQAVTEMLTRCRKKMVAENRRKRSHGYQLLTTSAASELRQYETVIDQVGRNPCRTTVVRQRDSRLTELHFLPGRRGNRPEFSRHQLYRSVRYAANEGLTQLYSDAIGDEINRAAYTQNAAQLTRSGLGLLNYAFQRLAREDVELRVEPVLGRRFPLSVPVVALAKGRPSAERMWGAAQSVVTARCLPEASELVGTIAAWKQLAPRGGYTLVVAGPLLARSSSADTGSREIDGCWLEVTSTRVRLHLVEVKTGKVGPGHAANEIRSKLTACGVSLANYVIEETHVGGDVGVLSLELA